jgi:hypothetical protein
MPGKRNLHSRIRRGGVLATALVLAAIPYGACGDHPQPAQPAGGPAVSPPAPPPGSSNIRTLVGVELDKLPGPAGDWARGQKVEREAKRQNQGWIQPVDISLGERRVGARVTGEFQFKNPTGKDQTVSNISSSCDCQAVFLTIGDKRHAIPKAGHEPIPVPKGATGKLEAVIVVPDGLGRRFTEVRVQTSDPENLEIRVGLSVILVKDLILERKNQAGQLEQNDTFDFGFITPRTARPFEFFVRSRDGLPFEIRRHGPLPEGLKLEFAPDKVEGKPERSAWKVTGQLGPGLREQAAGGTVTFDTDRETGFAIKAFGLVMPAVRIDPPLVSLGHVQASLGGECALQLTAVDPADDCSVARVELFEVDPKEPALTASFTNATSGRSARVVVQAPAGLRPGRIDGNLRIVFRQPDLPERVVKIMGFVR